VRNEAELRAPGWVDGCEICGRRSIAELMVCARCGRSFCTHCGAATRCSSCRDDDAYDDARLAASSVAMKWWLRSA
jgi:hypothetical protein